MNDKIDGLQRMLDFLAFLQKRGIHFFLEQQSPDALMATFTLVGARIEVEFFVDEIQFSVFKGHEDVETDEQRLYKLIEEHWD